MRTFVAIKTPKFLQDCLLNLQNKLGQSGVRMTMAKDIHLTLIFLGECSAGQLAKIENALKRVKFESFNLTLGQIGSFGGRNPKVIWVGLEKSPQLVHLAGAIRQALQLLGFFADKPFEAHLTLARVRSEQTPESFLDFINDMKVESVSFEVGEFFLLKSELSSDGPVYETMASFEAS